MTSTDTYYLSLNPKMTSSNVAIDLNTVDSIAGASLKSLKDSTLKEHKIYAIAVIVFCEGEGEDKIKSKDCIVDMRFLEKHIKKLSKQDFQRIEKISCYTIRQKSMIFTYDVTLQPDQAEKAGEVYYELALRYRDGDEVEKDRQRFYEFLQVAADLGHAKSAYEFGRNCYFGKVESYNKEIGKIYLNVAKDKGHSMASNFLYKYYGVKNPNDKGTPVYKSTTKPSVVLC